MTPDAQQGFRYVAIDSEGRRVNGVVLADAERAAFDSLRASGLSPLVLRPAKQARARRKDRASLTDRETVDFVSNLGHLLDAGADMRTALAILGSRAKRGGLGATCKLLAADIGGGGALDVAFERHLARHGAFVGAMVAAGEASGTLAGGLLRAAELIDSRVRLRAKLGSVLAYPAFVLASTVAALLALLLFVIPSLAPLVQSSDAPPPPALGLMMGASTFVMDNLAPIGLVGVGLIAVLLIAQRTGVLGRAIDWLLLNGPVGGTARGLVYGGFAIVAGGMLAAGAPISDTLRLAGRSLESGVARRRLEPAQQAVRQGHALSAALEGVEGFPASISRLATVGEATGALGPMLVRGGRLEEEAAMMRIERMGQILGPSLIVALGGLVGMLMAGLLSGVSQLGQTALQ